MVVIGSYITMRIGFQWFLMDYSNIMKTIGSTLYPSNHIPIVNLHFLDHSLCHVRTRCCYSKVHHGKNHLPHYILTISTWYPDIPMISPWSSCLSYHAPAASYAWQLQSHQAQVEAMTLALVLQHLHHRSVDASSVICFFFMVVHGDL